MDKQQLKQLRDKLPYRYTTELASRVKCSPSTVWSVMNGYRRDYFGILKAASDWINESEDQTEEILHSINIK